jgi:hypothetical protein
MRGFHHDIHSADGAGASQKKNKQFLSFFLMPNSFPQSQTDSSQVEKMGLA